MRIKVTTAAFGYMGLPCGLVKEARIDEDTGDAIFVHAGKEWALVYSDYEEQPFNPVDVKPVKQDALAVQIGGGHYKDFKIQPVEYIYANNIPFLEGNVIKYTSRHKSKNKSADIKKAIHCLELILQMEYGDE